MRSRLVEELCFVDERYCFPLRGEGACRCNLYGIGTNLLEIDDPVVGYLFKVIGDLVRLEN